MMVARARLIVWIAAAAWSAMGALSPAHPADVAQDAPGSTPSAQSFDAFSSAVREFVTSAGSAATLQSLAQSAGGRDVWAVQLALPGPVAPEQRPVILLVGGIDSGSAASSEITLRVLRGLLTRATGNPTSDAAGLLARYTLLAVPRANPDGCERPLQPPLWDNPRDTRPVDDDRDGVFDEDGPDDLNGDGVIAVMRVPDPAGEWLPDPDEPRLLRRAEALRGERGQYRLLLEGSDLDGDGRINEDPPGGVDCGRNWPHLFAPGTATDGLFPMSELETRALADYIVARRSIVAAMVYGENDILVSVPQGKDRGPTGQEFRELHPDDIALYNEIGEKYRARTGFTTGGSARPDGAFYAWLYSQGGVFTLAVSPWLPIDRQSLAPPTPTDSAPTTEGAASEPAAPPPQPAPAPAPKSPSGKPAADEPFDPILVRVVSSELNRKWLQQPESGSAAFLPWTDFDHPTLGRVQLGGFVPGFRHNPPAAQLDELAERQCEFLLDLAPMLPSPRLEVSAVRAVGVDLWNVEVRLVNDGYLPTHLAISRMVGHPPLILRPHIDAPRVVGGPPVRRVDWLAGSGGSVTQRWLVRGPAGGSAQFIATHPRFGTLTLDVPLQAAPAGSATTSPATEGTP